MSTEPESNRFYSPHEVARILRVSRGEVMRLIQTHELEDVKRKNKGWWRIPGESIHAYVRKISEPAPVDDPKPRVPTIEEWLAEVRERRAREREVRRAKKGLEMQYHFPMPFCLAQALECEVKELGTSSGWQAELKYDGMRAQVAVDQSGVSIWTRNGRCVTEAGPEIVDAARALPDGTVLDGEVLAWRQGRPLSFQVLQRRIGRKQPSLDLLREVPAVFMAFDVLMAAGQDVRGEPLSARRERLEDLCGRLPVQGCLRLSPVLSSKT